MIDGDEFRAEVAGEEGPDIDELIVVFVDHPGVPEDELANGPFITEELRNGMVRGVFLKYKNENADLGLHDEDKTTVFRAIDETTGLYSSTDLATGVGVFLVVCETSNVPEEFAEDAFKDSEVNQQALEAYHDWQQSLTMSERRLNLLDISEPQRRHPLFDEHLDNGEFREGVLDSGQKRYGQKILSTIGEDQMHPQKCYQNCANIIVEAGFPDRVAYYEGLMLPKQGGRVLTHSWLEIDGIPFEVSLPWHRPCHPDAVYFGQEIPHDVIREDAQDSMRGKPSLTTPYSITEEEREVIRNDLGSPNV